MLYACLTVTVLYWLVAEEGSETGRMYIDRYIMGGWLRMVWRLERFTLPVALQVMQPVTGWGWRLKGLEVIYW
jgi:hypothetical protein